MSKLKSVQLSNVLQSVILSKQPRSQHDLQQLAVQIAFNTPQPNGQIGVPVLLWGDPGQGKSSFLESFRQVQFPVETLIAAIHDPTDFSGLPMLIEGKVVYATPQWTETFVASEEGLLFLDELSTAPPAVQAALLRVVLERKVGAMQLPKGVRIVAAANRPDRIIGGWELSPPLANRFVHLNWSLPGEAYVQGIIKGFDTFRCPPIDAEVHRAQQCRWEGLVAAFLRNHQKYLNTEVEEGTYAFASPRTWSFAIMLLTSIDLVEKELALRPTQVQQLRLRLLKGCIGSSATLALIEFVKQLHLPSALTLLKGDAKLSLHLRDDELFSLWGQFSSILYEYHPPEAFLRMVKNYFQLVQTVLDNKRLDVIYVAFRNLLKTDFLRKALTVARTHSTSQHLILLKTIESLFADPALVELAAMLDQQKIR